MDETQAPRPVIHTCDVCCEEGAFLAGHVAVIGRLPPSPLRVSQCRRCGRFYCLQHGEPLLVELTEGELRPHRERIGYGAVPALICCPIDLGLPLGRRDGGLELLVGAERTPASLEAVPAERYLDDPHRCVRTFGGLVREGIAFRYVPPPRPSTREE